MQKILDEIWDRVVGGLDWLKQVVFGEFDDHRDLSAVVADMLVSFVPGVIIVTSARDLTAVLVRLARHPEKREQVEEWMLVVACAVPLVLPILAAAAGAAAAGVGAIVGGIGGSEAGAVLRAVCLLLIKQGAHALVEIVGFLRRFIKGDILAVLRDIRFAKYGEAIGRYIGEFIAKIGGIVRRVRAELLKLDAFHWLAELLAKLEDLERRFYAVQQSAVAAIPRALVELDARLQHVLSEALPHEPRLAHAGIPAHPVTPVPVQPQRVPTMQASPLGHAEGTRPASPPGKAQPEPNVHPESPREPKTKVMKEEKLPCFKGEKLTGAKAVEMDAQLAGQQAGLNNMTVQEYLDGRQAYDQRKLATGSGRGTGQPAVEAREKYETKTRAELYERYRAEMPPGPAAGKAADETARHMETMAALHNPDMVAGGANMIGGMGDRQVNSTIGGQWKSPLKGQPAAPTRLERLDSAANAVPTTERATTRMNARLERCK